MLKVCKFGGSSLSDGGQFAKVKAIVEADPSRKMVVASAPGRRSSDDTKVTDLLYLCHAHVKYDVPFDNLVDKIREKYQAIVDDCNLSFDIDAELAEIFGDLKKSSSLDYLVSRGEYLNAKLLAKYLGYKFVDAADWMCFKYDGSVDYALTESKLKEIYEVYGRIVSPGFYGVMPNGRIKVFSRGGSDISGAIAAASLDADIYENWTDVSGILMVDPRIIPNPKPIARVTYKELRELSYMGASVLHKDTVFPVRRKDIPVNIRNTNAPEDPGTIIREDFDEKATDEGIRFITGITGKKDFSIITIHKNNLDNKVSLIRKVLGVCEKYNVPVESMSNGVDCFSLVIPNAAVQGRMYEFVAEIREAGNVDDLVLTEGISLIAIVGRHMAYKTGISGKIFAALGANNVNIRTIEQGSDEICIIVGVYTEDFEKSIRLLYESFAK